MNGSSSAGITVAPMQPPIATLKVSYPGETDAKQEEIYKEFRESFSKGTLIMHFQEYEAGKYTRRYMDAYLEFMHLSGMISNLDYLEFRGKLVKEQI